MNKTFLHLLLLIFTITTWGYSWVLMKMGLDYAEPFTFAALRNAIGAVAMLIFIKYRSISWPSINKFPDFIAVGIFQTGLMFASMLYGMQFVTAGKTSVLLYTMPIWTIFMVRFYLKEKLDRTTWIGVALGTLGVISILGIDVLEYQSSEILFGELLIIAAAISWAVSNIWVKKRLGTENVYRISAMQLTFGALFLIGLSIPTEGLFDVQWNPHSIYILLFTGIIASAVDFTIWFYLIKNIDIKITTFSSMLVPVFGILFDWLILGTPLDDGVIIGGILILFGIYLVSKK
ncbi:MAG: DMT family transporter [Thermodesulfobacteriota bacterium]